MKPRSIQSRYLLVALLVAGSTLALVSWGRKQAPEQHRQQLVADTVPQKKNTDKKVRDLDEALEELNKVNLDIEIGNAMKEVEKALKEVNLDKIKVEVDAALKNVDFDKIKVETELALKEIDFEKMKKDVDQAMASVDWDKIKKDIEEAKRIDMSELQAEMKKVEKELNDIKPQVEAELKKAKVEVEKAKEELREYKTFVDALDKEGLINKNESYSIKHDDGELIINGKKVSDAVYARYRSFLEKHKEFNITKDKDDFDIDMD